MTDGADMRRRALDSLEHRPREGAESPRSCGQRSLKCLSCIRSSTTEAVSRDACASNRMATFSFLLLRVSGSPVTGDRVFTASGSKGIGRRAASHVRGIAERLVIDHLADASRSSATGVANRLTERDPDDCSDDR